MFFFLLISSGILLFRFILVFWVFFLSNTFLASLRHKIDLLLPRNLSFGNSSPRIRRGRSAT